MLLKSPLFQELEKQNNVKGSNCVCIQLRIDISKRRTIKLHNLCNKALCFYEQS